MSDSSSENRYSYLKIQPAGVKAEPTGALANTSANTTRIFIPQTIAIGSNDQMSYIQPSSIGDPSNVPGDNQSLLSSLVFENRATGVSSADAYSLLNGGHSTLLPLPSDEDGQPLIMNADDYINKDAIETRVQQERLQQMRNAKESTRKLSAQEDVALNKPAENELRVPHDDSMFDPESMVMIESQRYLVMDDGTLVMETEVTKSRIAFNHSDGLVNDLGNLTEDFMSHQQHHSTNNNSQSMDQITHFNDSQELQNSNSEPNPNDAQTDLCRQMLYLRSLDNGDQSTNPSIQRMHFDDTNMTTLGYSKQQQLSNNENLVQQIANMRKSNDLQHTQTISSNLKSDASEFTSVSSNHAGLVQTDIVETIKGYESMPIGVHINTVAMKEDKSSVNISALDKEIRTKLLERANIEIEQEDGTKTDAIQCQNCRTIFRIAADFEKHLINHCKKKKKKQAFASQYSCHMCMKSFKVLHDLENHMSTHESIGCPVCVEDFPNFDMYKKHVALHSREEIKQFRLQVEQKKRERVIMKHKLYLSNIDGSVASVNIDGNQQQNNDLQKDQYFLNSGTIYNQTHEPKQETIQEQRALQNSVVCENEQELKMLQVSLETPLQTISTQTSDHQLHEDSILTDPLKMTNCNMYNPSKETDQVDWKETVAKKYKCDDCDAAFYRQMDLFKHKYMHTGIPPWKCRVCEKSFLSSSKYKMHCMTHGDDYLKPFFCGQCGKGFAYPEGLRSHELAHKGIRPFVCNKCGKTFTQKGNLKDHMLIHSEDKPFKCKICDKGFKTKGDLTKHTELHTDVKMHQCLQCNLAFTRLSYLKRHMMIHTGEKPFSCDICGKTFRRLEGMNEHRRIHTGERPYTCQVCGASFKDSGNFSHHKNIHDPNHPKRKRKKQSAHQHQAITEPELVDQKKTNRKGRGKFTFTATEIDNNQQIAGSVIQVLPSSLFERVSQEHQHQGNIYHARESESQEYSIVSDSLVADDSKTRQQWIHQAQIQRFQSDVNMLGIDSNVDDPSTRF